MFESTVISKTDQSETQEENELFPETTKKLIYGNQTILLADTKIPGKTVV